MFHVVNWLDGHDLHVSRKKTKSNHRVWVLVHKNNRKLDIWYLFMAGKFLRGQAKAICGVDGQYLPS